MPFIEALRQLFFSAGKFTIVNHVTYLAGYVLIMAYNIGWLLKINHLPMPQATPISISSFYASDKLYLNSSTSLCAV